ncbi:MAG: 3-phosphoshikimate 1-carboxyvinyltransferase [Desulfobacterales bacterium]
MIEIKPQKLADSDVIVPGSKSYTHRILIAAALSEGVCTISNGLKSEDTLLTLDALKQMGIAIDVMDDRFVVHGKKGRLKPCLNPVYLGNSGTSMRLLTAVAALGQGRYTLTGIKRMQERPIQDLLEGLVQMGVFARSIDNTGCPPVEVNGGRVSGGTVSLKCGVSSQFLSALLLIAPYTQNGVEINIIEGPVSKPYVDMTIDVMEEFGVNVKRDEYRNFAVAGGQIYRAGSYDVEPDCSQAGYFWAAAAITGSKIKVKGTTLKTRQGDVRFTRLLENMGCKISDESDGISVTGGPLSAVTADMADMPDMVPTLAVVAAFSAGTTVIENVGHLKAKESDRLGSVVHELSKMGIEASCSDTGMKIKGGSPKGAKIETYGDHRMAMSFALAGLNVHGIVISDENCVDNIFLIGYRCTGKTSVGRFLAKHLGWSFVDTDVKLIREQGQKIAEIVSKNGWASFRKMEKQVIQRVCERDRQVVATGGGVVLDEDNVNRMKDTGVLVWLKADIKTIEKRMSEDPATHDFRPALTSKGSVEEIKETLLLRNPYYEKAMNFFIDTDWVGIEAVCSAILQKLGENDLFESFPGLRSKDNHE